MEKEKLGTTAIFNSSGKHDLRKEQQLLNRRSMEDGVIMIWRGHQGKMEIKFIKGKLNSVKYIEIIDEQVNMYAT